MRQPSPERGCEGKMRMSRKGRPDEVAQMMAARHGKRYGVYKCPHCDGYHLTTKLDNQDQYKPLVYITPK